MSLETTIQLVFAAVMGAMTWNLRTLTMVFNSAVTRLEDSVKRLEKKVDIHTTDHTIHKGD